MTGLSEPHWGALVAIAGVYACFGLLFVMAFGAESLPVAFVGLIWVLAPAFAGAINSREVGVQSEDEPWYQYEGALRSL